MKMFACPICGKVRSAPRKQKTCSRMCSHQLIKRDLGARYLGIRRRAGQAAGRKTTERTEALWRERWPDVPIAVARSIYQTGLKSGWVAGVRHGRKVERRSLDASAPIAQDRYKNDSKLFAFQYLGVVHKR